MSLHIKNLLALSFLLVLIATPLCLWFIIGPTPQLNSFPLILKFLGQATAMIGVTLFVIEFVLSARLAISESLLSGLNRVYIVHHVIGGAALICLLFHPLLLSLQYLSVSVLVAAQFFLPSPSETGMWFGISALTLLIVLLIFTFYIRLKYEAWKKTHQWMGVPLILAFIHTVLVPGVLSQNLPLKIYLIGLYIVGISAYLYQVIIKRYLLPKINYRVSKVMPLVDGIIELTAKPLHKPIKAEAGQFVFMSVKSPGIPSEPHPFSLTSASNSATISIAIKHLGDYTKTIKLVEVGARLEIEGPYGRFTQKHIHNPMQIWVAGGIGITPFIAFIRSGVPAKLCQVFLWYTLNNDEVPYKDETLNVPGLNVTIHDSSKSGRLTMDMITKTVPSFIHYDLLMCGPAGMMNSLEKQAKYLGMSASQIHTEAFKLLD